MEHARGLLSKSRPRPLILAFGGEVVAGVLVVNRSLCEHPTEGKKKQVLLRDYRQDPYSYWLGFPAVYPGETKLEREAGWGRLCRAVLWAVRL